VKTFIERLADCIDRQEGKDQNNNPGNLWDGITSGKPHRIWPDIPIDHRGMMIFPTPEAGRAALLRDLRIKMNRHEFTLRQAIEMYAPPNENNTEVYIANVAHWMGIPKEVADTVPLYQLERLERDGEVAFEPLPKKESA